jgi:hypothetical protein
MDKFNHFPDTDICGRDNQLTLIQNVNVIDFITYKYCKKYI